MATLDDLRRFTVSRSLFQPTTLERAMEALGFVQADPIRAPARAQDLTLRPRVEAYRAGDLERRYPALDVEEDVFINYGFVTRPLQALMHPRTGAGLRPTLRNKRAQAVLAFVRERGRVHPRDVDAHFSHGTVMNYWGGSSNATTRLLESMHYNGWLRVARRERGVRVYAEHQHDAAPHGAAARRARLDALVDFLVRKYAPLPESSLAFTVRRLRHAVPQWRPELGAALERAKDRLAQTTVGAIRWYWPADEPLRTEEPRQVVHLVAPFDPVVWDRPRFELLWGWAYRFEAYTPSSKRKLGYYALPLLWRDRAVGWGNLALKGGQLHASFGYVASRPPRDPSFSELDAEVERFRAFLTSAAQPAVSEPPAS
jgi:uncharacterized protein YcaQ